MTVDIEANLDAFLAHRSAEARYASFDYCFNHFQDARENNRLDSLLDGDGLVLSCLHLGYYLASWGMMRGSSKLLQRSVRELIPVVRTIVTEPATTWAIDVDSYAGHGAEVLALGQRVGRAFTFDATNTLVTKTLLGTFGCVPAFDRYFRVGSGCSTFGIGALKRIGQFYRDNRARIDNSEVLTLDVSSGRATDRRYPRAKIVDMVFFQEGLGPRAAL